MQEHDDDMCDPVFRPVQAPPDEKSAEKAQRQSELPQEHQHLTLQQLAELETIYRSIPLGLCVFDTDFRFVRINDRMAQINGIPASEHIGRTPHEVVPDLAAQAEKIFYRVLGSEQPVLDVELSGTTSARPSDQRTWVAHWLPLKDSTGKVIGVSVVAEDITERKQAEAVSKRTQENLGKEVVARTAELEATIAALENEMQERIELENQLRQWSRVFMDAADPIIIEDLAGIITDLNLEAERVYGWHRHELIGKSIFSLIPSAQHEQARQLRERCRRGEEVRDWESIRQGRSGQLFFVLLTAFPLFDESGNVQSLATITKDITLRKQMETELKESRRHLREVSRKSIEVLESDRQTTAKELHDSIGASLAAIKFSLEGIAEEIAAESEKAAASLAISISHLLDTIKETKRISAKLRPSMLDELGLLATVKWYLRQFSEQFSNIRFRTHIDAREEDIPEQHKIVIYRVLQESLHNAAKHSQAGQVDITLKSAAHQVVLEVADDGCGFDVQKNRSPSDPTSGYGLASMKERAEIVGGSFDIESSPGKGTHIKMVLSPSEYEFSSNENVRRKD
ncbi:MAG: PAS domain-containing protein [Desulfobacterales bacterium]|nr:MAG: PAS domain-containing protein [Desulfobacterales bacterium]